MADPLTPRAESRQPLVLMDAGLRRAPRVEADVRIAGRGQDFELPVWIDNEGDLRLALPKQNPQHSTDIDQVIFSVGDILAAIAAALQERATS